jgi:Zn-dependent protease with chaperone function
MLPQRSPRSALLLVLLALALTPSAMASPSDSRAGTIRGEESAPVAVTARPAVAGEDLSPSIHRRAAAPAATDSARRAYRGWIRRLRTRLAADSLARADGLRRSGAPTRNDSLAGVAARAPGDTLPRAASTARALAPPPDYIAMVRAAFTAESRAYATTHAALGFLVPLTMILLGLFILFSGLSAWMRDVACASSRRAYVQILVYLLLYLVAVSVLSFPLTFYEGFALERHYGLSTQGIGAWLGDELKALFVTLALLGGVPLVRLAYLAIRRFPRGWWLALGLGTLPVILAGALLQPLIVDPLFNRFTPLQDRPLQGSILEVARRAGIPARHVFEADGSRQTRKYNAYVSGFGPSQRIVVWDTTLRGMKPDEILFVVGHEAGHYRLGHMWQGIVLATLGSILVFWLCAIFVPGAMRRWGGRWGFTELHDIASLPLLWTAIMLFSFLTQPGANAFGRRLEHDADTFGVEITRGNDAAARAFLALESQDRADPAPSPLVECFEFDHPPLLERVRFVVSYRPWEVGQPNRLAPRSP